MVCPFIQKLNCPSEQKEQLFDAVIETAKKDMAAKERATRKKAGEQSDLGCTCFLLGVF